MGKTTTKTAAKSTKSKYVDRAGLDLRHLVTWVAVGTLLGVAFVGFLMARGEDLGTPVSDALWFSVVFPVAYIVVKWKRHLILRLMVAFIILSLYFAISVLDTLRVDALAG